jgi:4-carboxymuconolactone decarboxylase
MSDDARMKKAEGILDQVFTPAWRQHGGGVAWPSQAGKDFARLAVEHCYGDAWARGGKLDAKTRILLTITILTMLGNLDELKLHVQGALNLGHEPDDIVELYIQLLPYIGTPLCVQGMRVAGQVFQERAKQK